MTPVLTATVGVVIFGALCASGAAASPLPEDIAGKSVDVRRYPSFCQIPPRPRNVRTGRAFKEAVVEIRLAGARVAAQSAPGTFSLENTDGFANAARAEATPPPPMAPQDSQQTETFIDQARALARPPAPR